VQGIDWLNLNGPWEFRFDGDRAGEERRWFQPDDERWPEQIIVPFCWESLAAWGEADAAANDNYYASRVYRNPVEVTAENYRGADRFEVGWYRRRITVPQNDAWKNKRVILTIGAADFFTDVWCNGHHLGHHEGGYDPVEFDLTEALVPSPSAQLSGTLVVGGRPVNNTERRSEAMGLKYAP
jgi:beta-galactosidase/beta-glucuronidase